MTFRATPGLIFFYSSSSADCSDAALPFGGMEKAAGVALLVSA
jgi:hypothetical protein